MKKCMTMQKKKADEYSQLQKIKLQRHQVNNIFPQRKQNEHFHHRNNTETQK